ncbi:MAG: response regulator transcription factor [Spirochaetales bacterium]
MIRALLVDDHEATLEGLELMLTRLGLTVVGTNVTGENLEFDIECRHPDVVFLDLSLGPNDGIELAARVKNRFSQVLIIGFSFRRDQASVQAFLAAGANAYLLKTARADEVRLALENVFKGRTYISPQVAQVGDTPDSLTPQEYTLVRLIGHGKTSKEIAFDLGLSPRSVEKYRLNLMEKLHVTTLAELLKWGIRAGVIAVD